MANILSPQEKLCLKILSYKYINYFNSYFLKGYIVKIEKIKSEKSLIIPNANNSSLES